MSEQLEVLKLVAERLELADIAYMISGSIVTAEDLVLSKLVWAAESRSEIQLQDVRNLMTAVATLDWTYLEHWAAELTVAELLCEVRG